MLDLFDLNLQVPRGLSLGHAHFFPSHSTSAPRLASLNAANQHLDVLVSSGISALCQWWDQQFFERSPQGKCESHGPYGGHRVYNLHDDLVRVFTGLAISAHRFWEILMDTYQHYTAEYDKYHKYSRSDHHADGPVWKRVSLWSWLRLLQHHGNRRRGRDERRSRGGCETFVCCH